MTLVRETNLLQFSSRTDNISYLSFERNERQPLFKVEKTKFPLRVDNSILHLAFFKLQQIKANRKQTLGVMFCEITCAPIQFVFPYIRNLPSPPESSWFVDAFHLENIVACSN